MDYKTAEKAFELMNRSSESKLFRDVILYAVRYAQKRTDFWLATPEMRPDMNGDRTKAHNSLIDACNILSRTQAKIGEDNSWRDMLGTGRKEVGDFACHVNAILGIQAR